MTIRTLVEVGALNMALGFGAAMRTPARERVIAQTLAAVRQLAEAQA